jgi:hypothetical protein
METTTTSLFDEYYSEDMQNFACFEFGGFYQGLHCDIIESAMERDLDFVKEEYGLDIDESGNDLFDYDATCLNYVNSLLKAIDKELKTNFVECFVKIDSPKYYNYKTDALQFDKTKANKKLLDLIYKDDSALKDFLDDLDNLVDIEFDVELAKDFDLKIKKLKKVKKICK